MRKRIVVLILVISCLIFACQEKNECGEIGFSTNVDEMTYYQGCVKIIFENVKANEIYLDDGDLADCSIIETKECGDFCRFYFVFDGECEWRFRALGYLSKVKDFEVEGEKLKEFSVKLDVLPVGNFEGRLIFSDFDSYFVNKDWNLYSIRTDGIDKRVLAEDVFEDFLSVSSKGDYLLYNACPTKETDERNICLGGSGLKLIDIDGQLVEDMGEIVISRLDPLNYDWMHNNDCLISLEYWGISGAQISSYCLGTREKAIFYETSEYVYPHDIAISSDDQRVAFVIHSYEDDYEIYLEKIDRNGRRILTKGTSLINSEMYLQWLTDKELIFYNEKDYGLYKINIDSAEVSLVKTIQHGSLFKLSPDKKKLIYYCWDENFVVISTEIWQKIISFDLTSVDFEVGTNSFYSWNWAPNSEALVFYGSSQYGFSDYSRAFRYLFLVDLKGNIYRVLGLGEKIEGERYGGVAFWID